MRVTRLVLGVVGHVDHGKTALVRALTGMETDRLAEEKRRGISIALGFAHLTAGSDTEIDLIDMPGHERFVRTMISGATGIDAVLLVVAANEKVKPQTVEHIDIAALLGLRRAVIAVSKTDLVTPEEAARAAAEAASLVARAGLQAHAPVLTSAVRGDGMATLANALAELAAERAPPSADGAVFLAIDRAFSVAGHGTVVTGTLRGGAIAAGDTLVVHPGARTVRVRGVQVHGRRVASAAPGQRVAVNLRDVETTEVPRGAALAAVDSMTPSVWLTVGLRAVETAPPLRNGTRLRALLGTAETEARVRLLDRDVLEPGETCFAQLRCTEPVAIPGREHVILRMASPALTVAGGKVLEPETRRARRRDPQGLARLEALATLAPAEVVAAEVERAGSAGTTLARLSRLTASAPPRVAEVLQRLPVVITRGRAAVTRAALEAVLARIPPVLGPERAGLARDKLLAALPGVGGDVLDEALARLIASGSARQHGGVFSVPRPDEELARARAETDLAAKLAEALRRGGLTPPDAAALAGGYEGKKALDRLVRDGVVVRAHDRVQKRVILFHQDAIEEAQRRLAPLLERPPGLSVSEVGSALGISRKFSVPLLEHLDGVRFTRRIQDRRILAVPSRVG